MLFGILFSTSAILYQNAYAASPIVSAVADDPDNGDAVYSVGDTITITFPGATNATSGGSMTNTEFRANFTMATTDIDTADTVTGTWSSTSVLLLTIGTIAGADPPAIDTDTVQYDVANGNLFYAVNATVGGGGTEFLGNTVTLTGDFGIVSSSSSNNSGAGSGCNGDCEEPTLGVDTNNKRQVTNGFSYNGYSVDVERYFTPYPLITAEVGKTNIAEFKIYENQGVHNIRHFTFAFGMDKGDIISNSKAKIELDIAFDGTETVTVTDPENALDNIKVTTSKVSCMENSTSECLLVSIQHRFRAPLDFNIVGTDVWDTKRNSWQNYYNHGIEVVGESLNPPKQYEGVDRGHIYNLTETGKNTATDKFGDSWTFQYGTWNKDFIKNEQIQDSDTNVMTRTHSYFETLKEIELKKAIDKLNVLCYNCQEPFADFEESKSYDFPNVNPNKLDSIDIKNKLIWEENKVQKILNSMLNLKFLYK